MLKPLPTLAQEDQSPVTIFHFVPSPPQQSLLPLARNNLKKLRTLRHPDLLKFIDGSDSDNQVWIITERAECLSLKGTDGMNEETKIWGLGKVLVSLSLSIDVKIGVGMRKGLHSQDFGF
jgi:SCY1-like protein 1